MIFAWIIVIGVFLQVYFITAYFSGAGEGALDAHGFTGGLVVHGSELIVFLSSLAAFWGLWQLGRLELPALRRSERCRSSSRRPTTIRRAAGYTASTVSSRSSCSCSRRGSRTGTCGCSG